MKSMYKNNTSGYPGVNFIKSKDFYYWRSSWTEDGFQKQKTFSIHLFGYDRAKELAIEYRHRKMIELYKGKI